MPALKPVSQITDRAKRYRAQNRVRGPHRCVICGASGVRLDVMHLDGNEANGEEANLAYGCRPCNAKLAAAFKRIGAGVPTRQYNPAEIPSFQQYAWAVSQHSRGSHDEGGAIIHSTPKWARIKYAKRIAQIKEERGTMKNKATKSNKRKRPSKAKRLMKSGSKKLRKYVQSQGNRKRRNAAAKKNRKRRNPATKRNAAHTRRTELRLPSSGSTGKLKAREAEVITRGGKVREVRITR